jgi:hypothetical protein
MSELGGGSDRKREKETEAVRAWCGLGQEKGKTRLKMSMLVVHKASFFNYKNAKIPRNLSV